MERAYCTKQSALKSSVPHLSHVLSHRSSQYGEQQISKKFNKEADIKVINDPNM